VLTVGGFVRYFVFFVIDLKTRRVYVAGLSSSLVRRHASYYNEDRQHMSLDGDAPVTREVEPREVGKVVALPRVSGLHHRYVRRAA
jgi:hypothetical protein